VETRVYRQAVEEEALQPRNEEKFAAMQNAIPPSRKEGGAANLRHGLSVKSAVDGGVEVPRGAREGVEVGEAGAEVICD
jgi:hypothetical protein